MHDGFFVGGRKFVMFLVFVIIFRFCNLLWFLSSLSIRIFVSNLYLSFRCLSQRFFFFLPISSAWQVTEQPGKDTSLPREGHGAQVKWRVVGPDQVEMDVKTRRKWWSRIRPRGCWPWWGPRGVLGTRTCDPEWQGPGHMLVSGLRDATVPRWTWVRGLQCVEVTVAGGEDKARGPGIRMARSQGPRSLWMQVGILAQESFTVQTPSSGRPGQQQIGKSVV